eukprot:CAMPEP_0201700240 /NCGR_PEP_ID=MMETSP0578-20130828/27713_1 /ASSEMBLY_ACC=CAM_ASM_000663 /TAXON_ID=267565 /ORGANISM="Skeletonema grethea, Strain CCMP 1804" /LENGTH=249 /DNA_ID=CAMNT_0048187247 /DNA_START=235 /DNA_END=984 /DNA_ORIENTATION=+
MARSLTWDISTLNKCDDGTICENRSTCTPHPFKEGKYVCNCLEASNDIFFAGLYCEHKATDYCGKLGNNNPTFCTNNGTCRKSVGKNEEHVACQCPAGYVGDYCQFVQGSKPSDWQLNHFMNPVLMGLPSAVKSEGLTDGAIAGISVGTVLAALIVMTWAFIWCGRMNTHWSRNEKEMDTGDANAGLFSVGGKKSKKNSTTVTPDTLDADGGVLTDALEEKDEMEDVDLDEMPNSLELVEETGTTGELA